MPKLVYIDPKNKTKLGWVWPNGQIFCTIDKLTLDIALGHAKLVSGVECRRSER